MGASFLEPLEHDVSYELGIDMFIEGLPVLRRGSAQYNESSLR